MLIEYSLAGDVTKVTLPDGSFLADGYDAADNRLTRNLSGGPAETFTYGATNNRLQSAAVTGQPTRTFTTNAAGDITLDDRGAGNTVTIAIGANARPQTITVAGAGATTVSYKHNAFGERVSRVEGSTTTHFHYDQDGRLIAESDGTGVLVREYLWLGDKPLGLVVGPATSPTLYYVHADYLERVQKITDASQTIAWDGQFTPYGRTHAIAGTVQNPLRFPGQWADPAAGYFYNTMRDYDPTLGRYLSSDPIGTRGGRNRFGYAGANPQNVIDAFGLETTGPGPQLSRPAVVGRVSTSFTVPMNVRNSNYFSGMRVLEQIQRYDPSYRLTFTDPELVTGRDVEHLRSVLASYRARLGPNPGAACLPEQGPRFNQPPQRGPTTRPLTPEDLGINPRDLAELSGTFTIRGTEAIARIDMIRGTVVNPFAVVSNLSATAMSHGATSLRIEGTLANARLSDVLVRRYGMQSRGAVDFIVVRLRK
ncbi:MAG: RHS repeat-associated core domain-containing protein [Alphaproteobacteria bacterium]